tara:strand:- start:129 stop:551 length:423 start_codon:yes stop_codon:yes gene_type:complete
MTSAGALDAVAARLVAAGLTEARSPMGVRNEASGKIDRSFSVKPKAASLSQRGRERHRMRLSFAVELGHRLKPSAGADAPDQALADYEAAIRYIAVGGTGLTTAAAIDYGPAAFAYAGGGAYLITSFDLAVSFDLDLSIV